MIAFNSDRFGDMNLFIWRGSDNSVTQVTKGPGGDFQADWSPDLQNLVFFSARNGNSDIFTVSTNALSEPKALTTSPNSDYNPFYSPDGKHVLFGSDRDGGSELYVMKADGSDQRILIRDSSTGHFMRWQDSETVFNRVRMDGESRFYRIFLDNRDPEPVTTIFPLPRIGGHGSFSPDQKFWMDLNGPHTHIWTLEPGEESGSAIYNSQAGVTLDYPVWSPNGKWATFDYAKPGSSEILLAIWEDAQ